LPQEQKEVQIESMYQQQFEVEDSLVKRGLWKSAKSGNIEEF